MTWLSLLLAMIAVTAATDTDWSRFRGPNGSGVSLTKGLPAEFGPDKNVIWKTQLPQGFSSPIIFENRIFLTGRRDEALLTMALDRASGKVLWEKTAPRTRKEPLDKRNHPAAASAATDGQHVVVFFGDYGLVAYDVNGKELWKQPLGPFNNVYGMGSEPRAGAGQLPAWHPALLRGRRSRGDHLGGRRGRPVLQLAPDPHADAVRLARETGLRIGDLVELERSEIKKAPDGSCAIILRPNKRRRRIVNMPLTPAAEAIIDKAPISRRLILKPKRADAWDRRGSRARSASTLPSSTSARNSGSTICAGRR